LQNVPVIDEGGYAAWSAFHDLSARRTTNGFGPNPISTSEIVSWLNLHEVSDSEQRQDYYHLVCRLDDEWLKIVAERLAQQDRSRSAQNGKHRRGRT
jgi:hypothetical protein